MSKELSNLDMIITKSAYNIGQMRLMRAIGIHMLRVNDKMSISLMNHDQLDMSFL